MKKIYLLTLAGILGVVALFFISCNKEVISKPHFIFQPAPNKDVVAKVQGKYITADEFNKGIEGEIYEAKLKLYEIKMDRLEAILLERFVDADAKKKGLTNDQFLEKYISKGKGPSDSDIESFIKERKIPESQVSAQLKERIKKYLEIEIKRKAVDQWLAKQTKKHPVSIYFNKPKRPVFDVKIADSPSYGSPNSKITIVEFSEFQCPFCSKAADTIKKVKDKYKKHVRLVFKHFPLSFHNRAKEAALASMCANAQGVNKFWKMHDALFAGQNDLSDKGLKEKAEKVGLNMDKFNKCLKNKDHMKLVETDLQEGKRLGIKATPTFFINGQLISGALPMEAFEEIIQEELKK